MKIIRIDLEVSIDDYPADLFIDVKVPNDYEDWSSDEQLLHLIKHKNKIIKEAYENIVIAIMLNGETI